MEHSQKLPLPKGISPNIYRCLDVNWAEKLPVWGAHPITPIYMVSSPTTVNKMHDDDNKAPAEIDVTTLGHPDDWGSPCMTTQGPGDLKSSVSVFIFDAFV